MYKQIEYSVGPEETTERATTLKELLESAWCSETSVSPNRWDKSNPSYGQCAVTAMLVNSIVGGTIRRMENIVTGVHYYNVVDGLIVDLTADQFRILYNVWGWWIAYFSTDIVRTMDELEANKDTLRRYTLLRERFFRAVKKYNIQLTKEMFLYNSKGNKMP